MIKKIKKIKIQRFAANGWRIFSKQSMCRLTLGAVRHQ